MVIPNRLLGSFTTFTDAVEIAHGYTHNYYNLIGQSKYACSSHGGCVGGWLTIFIIFEALNITVDVFFVNVEWGLGMLVNAICIKFQQMDAVGIDNSVDWIESACKAAFKIWITPSKISLLNLYLAVFAIHPLWHPSIITAGAWSGCRSLDLKFYWNNIAGMALVWHISAQCIFCCCGIAKNMKFLLGRGN